MKFCRDTIKLETKERFQYINITERIQEIIDKSKIKDGMVFVNCFHNTATVIMQENDDSIHEDTKRIIEELIPSKGNYEHSYEGNANATSHIKNQILGNSNLTVPVKDGKLALGTWQQIFFLELLESRDRTITITVFGE